MENFKTFVMLHFPLFWSLCHMVATLILVQIKQLIYHFHKLYIADTLTLLLRNKLNPVKVQLKIHT